MDAFLACTAVLALQVRGGEPVEGVFSRNTLLSLSR